jgi:hypothetical protein
MRVRVWVLVLHPATLAGAPRCWIVLSGHLLRHSHDGIALMPCAMGGGVLGVVVGCVDGAGSG